jgi:hydrogenase expression/formation protein HypD
VNYTQAFRNPSLAQQWVNAIKHRATQKWQIMEVCGGQTHSIIKYGIDQLLANQVELIHGQ